MITRRNLPQMPSPSLAELRRLWRQHASGTEYDETIRRLTTWCGCESSSSKWTGCAERFSWHGATRRGRIWLRSSVYAYSSMMSVRLRVASRRNLPQPLQTR